MLGVLTFDTSLTKRKEIQENLRFTPPSNRVSYLDFEGTYIFISIDIVYLLNETWKPDIFTRISELVTWPIYPALK